MTAQKFCLELIKITFGILLMSSCSFSFAQKATKANEDTKFEELRKKLDQQRKEYYLTLTTLKCAAELYKERIGQPYKNGEERSKVVFSASFNETKDPGRLTVDIPNSILSMFRYNDYFLCDFSDVEIACKVERKGEKNLDDFYPFSTKSNDSLSLKLNRMTGVMDLRLSALLVRADSGQFVNSHRENGNFFCEKATKAF